MDLHVSQSRGVQLRMAFLECSRVEGAGEWDAGSNCVWWLVWHVLGEVNTFSSFLQMLGPKDLERGPA
ncbi:hypothetical protein HBH56_100210 [Parastagonospora nodorum]|nr:hypothetical protein HBH56_100210 [Parastagonospora nodorum]KAH3930221.1 hypothetical protein HBH54_114530 [Parastagonospora nodorum]KAH4136187.1 hypothetical protein HBH45_136630 [Parastagonospora nodorum]KAH4158214.1 hypothetical protein HBH44_118250 [Parastagonospora nodorum]KAH4571299.1 hypothetical protein HBH84_108990 [Parastagonospora nodorum]